MMTANLYRLNAEESLILKSNIEFCSFEIGLFEQSCNPSFWLRYSSMNGLQILTLFSYPLFL